MGRSPHQQMVYGAVKWSNYYFDKTVQQWVGGLALAQRAFNPHKISVRSNGSTGVFSSFKYSFMHNFSYKIGLCFAFFSWSSYRPIVLCWRLSDFKTIKFFMLASFKFRKSIKVLLCRAAPVASCIHIGPKWSKPGKIVSDE